MFGASRLKRVSAVSLSLLLLLCGGSSSSFAEDRWALLEGGFAKQMGLPVALDNESVSRLQNYVTEIQESIECGRATCAEWETDSSPILVALASIRELRKRGVNSTRIQVAGVQLSHGLHVALTQVNVTPQGRERFQREIAEVHVLFSSLADEVLEAVPVHPGTLRAVLVSSRLEGIEAGYSERLSTYKGRVEDDSLYLSNSEREQKSEKLSNRLIDALGAGNRDGALDLIEALVETVPGTVESDYLMAFLALFERDAMGVLEAIRRFSNRVKTPSIRLQGQIDRLGAIVSRRSRLRGQEERFLRAVVDGEKIGIACLEEGIVKGRLTLPCVSTMTRDEASARLKEIEAASSPLKGEEKSDADPNGLEESDSK